MHYLITHRNTNDRIMHVVTCEYSLEGQIDGCTDKLSVVNVRPGNTQASIGLIQCIDAARAMEVSSSPSGVR